MIYLPLLVAGLLAAIFWTRTIPGTALPAGNLLFQIATGAAVACVLVAATLLLARRFKPFELLAEQFRNILGHLSRRQIVWIAALSGAAEEVAFRGVIQPWLGSLGGPVLGLVATSLFFGLLHFVPDRVFLPWTIFATVVGFICGALYMTSGSVVPPVVTHALLNAINLELIVNGERRAT